jgi:hypothetical protein
LRWYKKIGVHFIHLLLINSYFLYNRHIKKISLYDYRISVIESLLPKKDNKTQKNSEAHLPKKVEKMKKTDIIKNVVGFVLIKKYEKKLYITVINVRMNQGYA